MAEPGRLGQLGRADRALHDRVQHDVSRVARLGELRVGVHHLGQEVLVEAAPVDADADGLAMVHRDPDDGGEVLVPVLGPDVAGIDPVLGERAGAGGVLGQEQVPVVVEVADDRRVHLADDVGDRARRLVVVDRHPDQLAAGLVKGAHLGNRSGDVGGVGVGHGLDDDRAGAAHLDAAHVDRHRSPALGPRHACPLSGFHSITRPRRPGRWRPRDPARSRPAGGRSRVRPRRSSKTEGAAGAAC